jgi:chromate transport protein ChrA
VIRRFIILPHFLIVAAPGARYVHFGGLSWMTAMVYGMSLAVIARILHSCWRLAKLGMEDSFQWLISIVALVLTMALETEVVMLSIGAGILYYGSLFRGSAPPAALVALTAPIWIDTLEGRGRADRLALLVWPERLGRLAVVRQFSHSTYTSTPVTWMLARRQQHVPVR